MSEVSKIKQAVILAGGLGTRLAPLTNDTPKPMIQFHGRPFLEYLIELLRENGITEIILLLGYLAGKITAYFEDGSKFGVKLKYSITEVEGTGTAIKKSENLLADQFLLVNGDTYWPLNLQNLIQFHNQSNPLCSIVVYTNKDAITKNNVLFDQAGSVVRYDATRQEKDLNGVHIGFSLVNKEILRFAPATNFLFEPEIFPQLISRKKLFAYQTDQRHYTFGRSEQLPVMAEFLAPKNPRTI